MIEINSHLIQPLLKSSLPLLFGGGYYLLGVFFSNYGLQEVRRNYLHDDFLESQGINQNNGINPEEMGPDLLVLLNQLSFGIYSNLFTFLLVMLLIELFLQISQNGIQEGFWKRVKSFSRSRKSSFDISKEWRLFNLVSENQIKRIFSYLVIFMILQILGLCLSLVVQNGISRHPNFIFNQDGEPLSQVNLMNHQNHIDDDLRSARTLEELDQGPLQNTSFSSPIVPDKISLSMGNRLGSLDLAVNAMVLSKDKKTAFVTIDFYGTLKIIDISDLQSPLIVSSLNLRISTDDCRIKNLILSSDEKTLYASNSKYLEIVDISDLSSPKLISETRSELFDDSQYEDTFPNFKTSIVVSESTKTLYIGGLGLQVYDISDPKEPGLLKAFKNKITQSYGIAINEICLSRDEKILFIASGSLDVYNISNPREMKLLYSFKTESSPRSLLLDEDSQTMLLLGASENDEIIFEEADISNLDSFKVKKTLSLGYTSYYSPRFLAISPSRSKLFIFAHSNHQGGHNLLVFDRIKEIAKETEKYLIEDTFALDFGLDSKTLITASNNQFLTIELFLDYPNTQIFSPAQENLINNISLPLCEQMQMSADGQYLFALCKRPSNSYLYALAVWDVKNLSEPISLFNTQKYISHMHFDDNFQTAYLIDSNSILVLDITDRSSIMLKKSYKLQDRETRLEYFIPSSDEKTGFIIKSVGEKGYVSFIDLSSNSSTVDVFLTLDLEFKAYNSRLIVKDDDKTLIVLSQKIFIYDISKTLAPQQMASLPFGVNEPVPDLSAHLLSRDKKILYVETFDINGFYKLKIFDISILTSPQLISEKYFPRIPRAKAQPGLSLSPDLNTGYMFHQPNSLIKLNLTDLKQPQVIGVIPLYKGKEKPITSYVLSPDGKTIYASDSNQIRVIDIELGYTLFLKQEKFLVGKKYSDSIAMLHLNASDYNRMGTESFRVIKLSLLDMKVSPNRANLDMTTTSLPSWMTFDRESNILTVESKKQSEIGRYNLCSAFSLKIPKGVLKNLGGTTVSSDDLWAWLISLDYVDPQLYLTDNFGGLDDFFLPSNFTLYREEIYYTLKKYYIETCTSFEIISSLGLENKGLLTVSSLSTSPIKVEIKLEPGQGVDAKFVSKTYGSLAPMMKENKTKVSLEGSLKEINTAINSLVVNFGDRISSDANVVINDDLNPSVSIELKNIPRYFKANQPPRVNARVDKTVQEQINVADIQTGKYFTFAFSSDTFEDEYAENLQYEVMMTNNNTAFPTWLHSNGLTLKGTPPEEISGRNIDLILIAKNEFKENQIPFRLHISISAVFWLKLVVRYIPYILTLIGLFASANKIFNVLRKGFYKHSKEFYIGVGQEISTNVIFPISFVKEELKQSQLILRQLGNMKVADFIDQGRQVIDKEKIISRIKEATQNIKKQVALYPSSIIDQIIMNKFVWMQLDSEFERKTRSLFEDLEPYCLEVVEKDGTSSGFTINTNKLNKLIKRIQRRPLERNDTLEESLISHQIDVPEGVNIHLLKDAILAYAFDNHCIDISPISADIVVKQQIPSNVLFRFLKLDLKDIYLDYKNKMNYGINYQIIDDQLCFYGIAQNYFKGKTIAIQIKNRKQRIMKEIWIRGVLNDPGKDESFIIRDEQEARGQGYEIF